MNSQGDRTLFGRISEKNVYFLIDTSGSMYHQLGFVKSHLIEVEFWRFYWHVVVIFTELYFQEFNG
jgi:hypothetical protein